MHSTAGEPTSVCHPFSLYCRLTYFYSPGSVAGVCEGQVAGPQVVVHTQYGQGASQRVSSLHPYKAANSSSSVSLSYACNNDLDYMTIT